MRALSGRVFLGCVAGALSILMFHQPTLELFHWLGWSPLSAFRIAQVPPFNTPLVVSITFWGAVYGGLFGLVLPWTRAPLWLLGMAGGLVVALLAWFVFLPLMGRAMAFGWRAGPLLRSFVAYQMWGLGVALLLPLLHPRRVGGRSGRWSRDRLAA